MRKEIIDNKFRIESRISEYIDLLANIIISRMERKIKKNEREKNSAQI